MLLWELGMEFESTVIEMSPGLFQDLMVFVPGVTEEIEDMGSV